MLTSIIIKELQNCVYYYGDRPIRFVGIKKNAYDKAEIFEEEVTDIHVIFTADKKIHPTEPFYIHGDRYAFFRSEPLIKLNWFGRIIKRFIVKK